MLKEETRKLLADGIMVVWDKYERNAATIAKAYGVSPGTVYAKVEAYCIEHNKDYQNFLRFPHRPHVFKVKRSKKSDIVVEKSKKRRKPVRSPKRKVVTDFDSDIQYLLELINSATPDDIDELIFATEMLLNITQTITIGG